MSKPTPVESFSLSSECPPEGMCYPVIIRNVRDGDTIDVSVLFHVGVRLAGIDAPELRYPKGVKSKEKLIEFINEGSDFRVYIPHKEGKYPLRSLSFDRVIGHLYDGRGRNVSQLMLESGLVSEYKK